MYGLPPLSTDKHLTGRPAYDISQCCAYGSGAAISALCQQLKISGKNCLEFDISVLNVVPVRFKYGQCRKVLISLPTTVLLG